MLNLKPPTESNSVSSHSQNVTLCLIATLPPLPVVPHLEAVKAKGQHHRNQTTQDD